MQNRVENHTPFFIIGSGRSGSTLLRMILCAHSRVTIPPETYFIAPLVERFPIDTRLTAQQAASAIDIITAHYRWPDMGMSREDLVDGMVDKDAPFLVDILNVIYEFHLARDGKQIWGDKTPPYIAIVPQLRELYPGARFIHLIRDGRDVTRSFQATGWYGPWLHDNTREWKEAIRYAEKYRSIGPGQDFYEVHYEDLVLETELSVRDICRFLDIEYEPGMLHWDNAVAGRIPAREAHIHKKISRKPARQDVSRWKSELTKRELFVVESYIYDELKIAGYDPCYSGNFWRAMFYGCRAYCATIIPFYAFVKRATRFVARRISLSH